MYCMKKKQQNVSVDITDTLKEILERCQQNGRQNFNPFDRGLHLRICQNDGVQRIGEET